MSFSILNISIVGAGIGGLTAALALRRNGHHVQVFEASETKTEVGAALGVPLNALRILDHLGISRANLKSIPWSGAVSFDSQSGESTKILFSEDESRTVISLLCHRSDLYEELKRLAIGDGEGLPVGLHLGAKVVECDPEAGTISLNSGEVVHADLILGADGVHSVVRTHILGEVQKPSPSGVSCFRTTFELPDGPELQWLTEKPSGTRNSLAKEGPFRMILMYPCRNGTLLNFIGFYDDSLEDAGGWKPKGSREDILAKFQDYHPKLLSVLDLPPQSEILKWQLGVLPRLPTWVRGRAALLGDAAHATLPFLAQGAAMAIEEAGSLGCLFPAGTHPEDVPERLKAYQDIRKDRGDFVNHESVEQLKSLRRGGPVVRYQAIQAQLVHYDALGAARECYETRFGRESSST
ncbi:FAD/NAD(P)-binding domain-containing protein [Mycena albidolilacea]|uniref:FAD/NAD(P)-binding domain-containing protein n=1 Tax=Mycena albidolilacea TaxID=1033008 RepID=A0AAD7AG65_9AGAR|nr:FAD/NAD(P)-binding domain-containing protein [Mycena albidolilacea]